MAETVIITMDEWLVELDKLCVMSAPDGGAMTTMELAAAIGKNVSWVRQKIKLAISQGLVELTHKVSVRIDSRPITIPAYRLVKKGKKKG